MSFDRFPILAVVLAALFGCDDGRTAGGTVSTEAGNAVATRLVFPDGRPAVGAMVVARPGDAVDSSTSASWVRGFADGEGMLVLHLPKGAWTLEVRSLSLGCRFDVILDGDSSLGDTLHPMRDLSGIVLGAGAGGRILLPGLARSTEVQVDGTFFFPQVPPGIERIRLKDGPEWNVAMPGPDPVLVLAAPGGPLAQGEALRFSSAPVVSRYRIPDSLVPDAGPVLVDPVGNVVSVVRGSRVGDSRLVWAPPLPSGAVAIGSIPATVATSPFLASGGLRLAWVPDLAKVCQIPSSGGLAFDSSTSWGGDSLEGGIVSTALGVSSGIMDTGLLPDTGSFSASFRVRSRTQGVGRLWILDWSDPSSGNGLRVGIGADRLWLRWGSVDTSVALVASSWRTVAVAIAGPSLSVSVDGNRLADLESDRVAVRSGWSNRAVASAGGLDLAWILAWDVALDPNGLSLPR